MAGSIDRRAARTRRALHDALMTLILRKGFDALTVQDIAREADVGRSTFYAHYPSKEELLRDGFRILRAELSEAIQAAPMKTHYRRWASASPCSNMRDVSRRPIEFWSWGKAASSQSTR